MKNIAIVAGGYSGESVISMQSADTVANHLDRTRYTPYLVVIDRAGWAVHHNGQEIPVDRNDFSARLDGTTVQFDGVFMAIHGPPGEDGKLQGYFDTLDIPYNCCNVFSAALTFHKAGTNRYLRPQGILSANNIILTKGEAYVVNEIVEEIGLPCFVKPNGSGSSLGISKVKKQEDLEGALAKAFAEDDLVMVESFIEGTEITCGCHYGANGVASIAVTEIVAEADFFDFEAKYHDDKTQEITPARISQKDYDHCMRETEKIYQLLGCKGMIRADYILREDGLFLIEVNTVPGLSQASLIPKMVEAAGWDLTDFFTNSVEQMFA